MIWLQQQQIRFTHAWHLASERFVKLLPARARPALQICADGDIASRFAVTVRNRMRLLSTSRIPVLLL